MSESETHQNYFVNFWKENLPTRNIFVIILIVYLSLTIVSIIRVDVSNLNDVLLIQPELLALVGQFNLKVYQGHIYMLFTSIFVHAGFLHFLTNCLFLFIYGLRAEERFFPWQYYIIFVVSGLMGSLLTLSFGPYTISVGASGGIFGLLGADLILAYEENRTRALWIYLGMGGIFLALSGGINVNFLAHAIGLVSGVLLPLFVLKKRKTKYKTDSTAIPS